jgi:CheY-like chemotaxis protein
MIATNEPLGAIALIDDDSHSARLLGRALLAAGAPSVSWIGDAGNGIERLQALIAQGQALPELVLVDLKESSSATLQFLRAAGTVRARTGLMMAAMSLSSERSIRDQYLAAGAVAVFVRHGDREAYREEAAGIVNFWAQSRRVQAIGM